MTQQRSTALATILFTDLVSSTELLQRAGDEDAQRMFKAHHKLLRDAVAAAGGQEVKWLGDGLMVAFPSAADGVRCAVAMQRASRRAVSGGERLAIRVGLHAGEALIDEADYFGTTVVIARRLCDSALAGQILCSALVSGLLTGRHAFAFRDAGPLALKGIAAPVHAAEVLYERDDPAAFLAQTPFVGRAAEVAQLTQKLREADTGRGGMVMLVGEPGIGKTRTCDEFAELARASGARVLRGRCFEGEWSPPYAPFAEAIEAYARDADADELRADLGYGAPPIARMAPSLRERLRDIEEPAALQPDEERFRLLDAVSQFLIAVSRRAPVVLVLDYLHWADRGTIGMMRHVARFAPQQRILVLGAYRDVELDRQHPLADALAALRREVEYERIVLKGLVQEEVGTLLATIAEQEVNAALVAAISDETDGNPFFIREVLIHLVQEGKLYREEGQWRSKAQSIADLGIPEGVRQVITRRLSRLSGEANRLMTAASAFNGGFRFQTIAGVADLDESATLDAIDEALDAQLLRPEGRADHYDFTHALIRHTLYGEMNPSRQVRLHRKIADLMSQRVATYTPERQASHAAELAYQFHRSAAIAGAERGVRYALEAADYAEASGAWDESVTFLRMALDLMPEGDARRPRVMGRLGTALTWALQFDDALTISLKAAELIATAEGDHRGAEYLADAEWAMDQAGSLRRAWELASAGIRYLGEHRDLVWLRLISHELERRAAEDPEADILGGSPTERREVARVLASLPEEQRQTLAGLALPTLYATRSEALRVSPSHPWYLFAQLRAGEYGRSVALATEQAAASERGGRIAVAIGELARAGQCHVALGELNAARAVIARAEALRVRLPGLSGHVLWLITARDLLQLAVNDHWEGALPVLEPLLDRSTIEYNWALPAIRLVAARIYAFLGRTDEALRWLNTVRPPTSVEFVASDATGDAALTLWVLNRTDSIEAIERITRSGLASDLRSPMADWRLSLARLCALQHRYAEAINWFAKARIVLEEQGARPLRAIVDYDEALMYARRGADGDGARARPLLDAALAQMREIGMTGWVRRAEELRSTLP